MGLSRMMAIVATGGVVGGLARAKRLVKACGRWTAAGSLLSGMAAPAPAAEPPCEPGSMRYESRALALCRLPQDTPVAGHLLPAASTLWFSEQGPLARVRLGREAPVLGLPLPEGTELFFHPDGALRFFWLPRDTRLQGHLVRAQDDGQGNRLHPNGTLRAIWLAEDETIDGVPCSSSGSVWRIGWRVIGLGTRRMAWFHDNGRLKQAMLGQDAVIQGRALRRGEVVRLDAQGRLEASPAAFDE